MVMYHVIYKKGFVSSHYSLKEAREKAKKVNSYIVNSFNEKVK